MGRDQVSFEAYIRRKISMENSRNSVFGNNVIVWLKIKSAETSLYMFKFQKAI